MTALEAFLQNNSNAQNMSYSPSGGSLNFQVGYVNAATSLSTAYGVSFNDVGVSIYNSVSSVIANASFFGFGFSTSASERDAIAFQISHRTPHDGSRS